MSVDFIRVSFLEEAIISRLENKLEIVSINKCKFIKPNGEQFIGYEVKTEAETAGRIDAKKWFKEALIDPRGIYD